MNITILIPTYNERENLLQLIPILYERIYPMRPAITFSTLIVDDRSPDGTRAILRKFSQIYPHFYCSSGDKRGIGAAMKRGYAYALKYLSSDAIVTYEADFIFDPTVLLSLVDQLSTADVVLAARENDSLFYRSSYLRRWGHFLTNTVIPEWIGGFTLVHEHTAAGRAIRVSGILDRIQLDTLPDGYAFFPAILYGLHDVKSRFCELSVVFCERRVGSSKLLLSEPLRVGRDLIDATRAALLYRRRRISI